MVRVYGSRLALVPTMGKTTLAMTAASSALVCDQCKAPTSGTRAYCDPCGIKRRPPVPDVANARDGDGPEVAEDPRVVAARVRALAESVIVGTDDVRTLHALAAKLRVRARRALARDRARRRRLGPVKK
jgi:hypothetical protein